MLLDLVATPLGSLWPGYRYTPPTNEGILWHAASFLNDNLDLFREEGDGDALLEDFAQFEDDPVE